MTAQQQLQLNIMLTNAHNDYGKMLSAYAFFKVSSPDLCKDLVQQTFMKAWVYLIRGGKVERMKVFLYKILDNLIIDEYRKKKTVSLDYLMETGYEPKPVDSKSLLNNLDAKIAIKQIESLPSIYREVVHMRYVENLTLQEISLVTGKSKNTLAVRLNRGIKKLRVLK